MQALRRARPRAPATEARECEVVVDSMVGRKHQHGVWSVPTCSSASASDGGGAEPRRFANDAGIGAAFLRQLVLDERQGSGGWLRRSGAAKIVASATRLTVCWNSVGPSDDARTAWGVHRATPAKGLARRRLQGSVARSCWCSRSPRRFCCFLLPAALQGPGQAFRRGRYCNEVCENNVLYDLVRSRPAGKHDTVLANCNAISKRRGVKFRKIEGSTLGAHHAYDHRQGRLTWPQQGRGAP